MATTRAQRAPSRQPLVSEIILSPEARERDGHLVAWSHAARQTVAAYLDTIVAHPDCTIILRLEVQH